jgi:hypothetical protein
MRTTRFLLAATLLGAACTDDDVPTTAESTAPQTASGAVTATANVITLHESRPGLLALARIREADARATALERVPGGRIVEAELEEEGGRLVYSYDIKLDGVRGIVDVEIDATTGVVLHVAREDDDDDNEDDSDDSDDDRRPAKRGS